MPNKKCIVDNCIKPAKYNIPEKWAEYCKTHKQNGMIDVTRKHCEYELCYTRANLDIRTVNHNFAPFINWRL